MHRRMNNHGLQMSHVIGDDESAFIYIFLFMILFINNMIGKKKKINKGREKSYHSHM